MRDVRQGVKMLVVRDDGNIILGEYDFQFQIISPLSKNHDLGWRAMFWQTSANPAMREDQMIAHGKRDREDSEESIQAVWPNAPNDQ